MKKDGSSSPAAQAGRQILDSIRRVVQELRIASRRAESDVGLSGAQLFVLQKLGGDRAVSLNELASRTLTHQSSVSVVVQRLVERGLVQRTRSKADARQLELSLTPAGLKAMRSAPGAAQDRLIQAVGRLSAAERQQLALLLDRVTSAMGLGRRQASMLFEESNGERAAKP